MKRPTELPVFVAKQIFHGLALQQRLAAAGQHGPFQQFFARLAPHTSALLAGQHLPLLGPELQNTQFEAQLVSWGLEVRDGAVSFASVSPTTVQKLFIEGLQDPSAVSRLLGTLRDEFGSISRAIARRAG